MSNINEIVNVLSTKGLTEAELKQQMKSVKQIELVSAQAGISLKEVDILKLFGTGDEKLPIITDPKEINKRLFDHHEFNKNALKRANLEELLKLEKRIKTYHAKYFTHALHRAKMYNEGEIRGHKSTLDRYEKSVMSLNKDLADAKKQNAKADIKYLTQEIESMQNTLNAYKQSISNLEKGLENINTLQSVDGFMQILAKITLGGFWKLIDFKKDKLLFITVNDVILFNKNKRSGLNAQLNFGTLCCEFDLSAFVPTVVPFINNIKHGGNIHPYCNVRGSVCMGNAYGIYDEYRLSRDFVGCMSLLGNILSAYSDDGGPHKPLGYFVQEHFKMEPSGTAKKYLKKKNESIAKRVELLMNLAEDNKKTVNSLSKTLEPPPRPTPEIEPEDEEMLEDDFDEEELESNYFEDEEVIIEE